MCTKEHVGKFDMCDSQFVPNWEKEILFNGHKVLSLARISMGRFGGPLGRERSTSGFVVPGTTQDPPRSDSGQKPISRANRNFGPFLELLCEKIGAGWARPNGALNRPRWAQNPCLGHISGYTGS